MNDDSLRQKHLPKSPRNHLMYYILNDNIHPGLAIATLKQLLTMDQEKDISSNYFQGFSSENQNEPPLKR